MGKKITLTGKKNAAIALCIASAFYMFAEEPESQMNEQSVTLNVEQAVSYAMEHCKTLKSSELDLDIKRRAGKYGWNVLLPSLTATGTLSRQNDISDTIKEINDGIDLANAVTSANTPHSKETESGHWVGIGTISVSWNFTFAYLAQIRAAKINYENGKITYEKSLRQTEVNVRKMFYGILLAQEQLKIKRNALENARKRANQSEINYKNGIVPELQYLQNQVAYENKRPDVSKLTSELNQQLDAFAILIGYPVGTKIELEGTIQPEEYIKTDFDELYSKYASNNLDIQALEKQIAAAKLGIKGLNLATYLPTLATSWSYQPTYTNFLEDKLSKDPSDKGSFSLSLTWNLSNLLPFSKNQQQIADYKAQLKQAEIGRELALENQKMEIRKAIDTLNNAREQIKVMSRNVSLADRSYQMTLKAYNNGTKEYLDLKDSEDQLNQSWLALASQKFNYISALLDLETALNTKLTGAEK